MRKAFCLLIVGVLSLSLRGQVLNKAEYFVDADPGVGNGLPVTVTPGASISANFSVNINALSHDFHTLNFRIRDSNGLWSHFQTRSFLVMGITPPLAITITKAEYFLDTDPGLGNAVNVPLTVGPSIDQNLAIPINALTPGFHSLNFRVRDNKGEWSLFATRMFYVIPAVAANPLATVITKAEYFFDADPGAGSGINIPVTPSGQISSNTLVPTTSLTSGFHTLSARVRDDQGRWSHFSTHSFYLVPTNALNATDIRKIEYYIDTDPGIGLATNFAFTPSASIDQLFAIDLSGVGSGAHKLFVRAKDNQGFWSTSMASDFTILACSPPAAPTAPGSSRCNSGTVVLTASGASGSNVYRWYADATTSTLIFTGPSFTTPVLTTTTTYYTSIFDPATLCESARTAVAAGIISTLPPLLNVTGSVTICQGNSITLVAPAGFSDYIWSNGATTQQIMVNTAGNYTVVVGNGTCQSAPSLTANINIAAKPAKPVITATGSLCTALPVLLQGPSGFAVYTWSNGAATQQTSVTPPGIYTLTVSDINGCTSVPSDAIVLNGVPAKPNILVVGNTTLCEGQTVTLLGPGGFASYQWSTGATTQQITADAAGNYTLHVADANGCVSAESDPTSIVVNPGPCGSSHPPAIQNHVITVSVKQIVTTSLVDLLSDPDGDLDASSLSIVRPLASGAGAALDAAGNITLDYSNTLFAGDEVLTLEVCDVAKNCTREDLTVRVVGEIVVYNAVSPNGDGLNEVLLLEYVDILDEAKNNRVRIFNRWGDVVYEAENYNNSNVAFKGVNSNGDRLAPGTYFYRIDFSSGIPFKTGFISLRQ